MQVSREGCGGSHSGRAWRLTWGWWVALVPEVQASPGAKAPGSGLHCPLPLTCGAGQTDPAAPLVEAQPVHMQADPGIPQEGALLSTLMFTDSLHRAVLGRVGLVLNARTLKVNVLPTTAGSWPVSP